MNPATFTYNHTAKVDPEEACPTGELGAAPG